MAENWLENLKPGDPVFVSQRFGGDVLRKVTRMTKTQIVVGYENGLGNMIEDRFRRDSGWSVGSDRWIREYLLEPTPERYEQREIAILKRKAEKMREGLAIPQTKGELKKLIEALTPFQAEVSNG